MDSLETKIKALETFLGHTPSVGKLYANFQQLHYLGKQTDTEVDFFEGLLETTKPLVESEDALMVEYNKFNRRQFKLSDNWEYIPKRAKILIESGSSPKVYDQQRSFPTMPNDSTPVPNTDQEAHDTLVKLGALRTEFYQEFLNGAYVDASQEVKKSLNTRPFFGAQAALGPDLTEIKNALTSLDFSFRLLATQYRSQGYQPFDADKKLIVAE